MASADDLGINTQRRVRLRAEPETFTTTSVTNSCITWAKRDVLCVLRAEALHMGLVHETPILVVRSGGEAGERDELDANHRLGAGDAELRGRVLAHANLL